MATPKPNRELHQLKLKLTKDPRATTVKLPTPTKQHPPMQVGTTSSSDQPRAPAAKVLKLSDVIIVPARSPGTPPVSTKHIPIKPAFRAATAANISLRSSTACLQSSHLTAAGHSDQPSRCCQVTEKEASHVGESSSIETDQAASSFNKSHSYQVCTEVRPPELLAAGGEGSTSTNHHP